MKNVFPLPSNKMEAYEIVGSVAVSLLAVFIIGLGFGSRQKMECVSLPNNENYIRINHILHPAITGGYSIYAYYEVGKNYSSGKKRFSYVNYLSDFLDENKKIKNNFKFLQFYEDRNFYAMPRFRPREIGCNAMCVEISKSEKDVLIFTFGKDEMIDLHSIKTEYEETISKVEVSQLAQTFDE